jgi:hypothetical protein
MRFHCKVEPFFMQKTEFCTRLIEEGTANKHQLVVLMYGYNKFWYVREWRSVSIFINK